MRINVTALLLTACIALPAFGADSATASGPSAPPAIGTAPGAPAPESVVTAGGAAPPLGGASVWGRLPWGGFGAGGRFMIPLKARPLLRNTSVRDSFALEFGADILHWSYDNGLSNFN